MSHPSDKPKMVSLVCRMKSKVFNVACQAMRGAPTASSSPMVPFPLFPVPHLKLLCAAALRTLLLPCEVHSLSLLGLCMWFSFYQKHFPLTPTFLASDFGFLWRHFLTLPVWFKHHYCGL